MNKWLFALLTTLSLSAVAAPKVNASATAVEKPRPIFVGAESVFFSHEDEQGWMPGFGLSVGQTPGTSSGWIWDAGVYLAFDERGGDVLAPVFFHFGYQFGRHFRLWGYAAGVILEGIGESEGSLPILMVGPELEVLPVHTEKVQLSLLAGIPMVYFVIPTYPYVGGRAVVSITNSVSVQTILRYAFTEHFLLGSAGLMVKF